MRLDKIDKGILVKGTEGITLFMSFGKISKVFIIEAQQTLWLLISCRPVKTEYRPFSMPTMDLSTIFSFKAYLSTISALVNLTSIP